MSHWRDVAFAPWAEYHASLRSVYPGRPITWLSTPMHDRHYQQRISVREVNDVVRKSVQKSSSDTGINCSTCIRLIEDTLNDGSHLSGEPCSQSSIRGLVVSYCIARLCPSRRTKREFPGQRVSSFSSSKTCSPGIGIIERDRNSATRFRISARHACSTSESSSRLSSNRSANRARSGRGRSSAMVSTWSIKESWGFIVAFVFYRSINKFIPLAECTPIAQWIRELEIGCSARMPLPTGFDLSSVAWVARSASRGGPSHQQQLMRVAPSRDLNPFGAIRFAIAIFAIGCAQARR